MLYLGIRYQYIKYVLINIGQEIFVNFRDIWVLGYFFIIISVISNYYGRIFQDLNVFGVDEGFLFNVGWCVFGVLVFDI